MKKKPQNYVEATRPSPLAFDKTSGVHGEAVLDTASAEAKSPPKMVPFVIHAVVMLARASHVYTKTDVILPDPTYLPTDTNLHFGEDATFGVGKKLGKGIHSQGKTPEELKEKMNMLLDIFVKSDGTGGSIKEVFKLFLAKQSKVKIYSNVGLDQAAAHHPNIASFCDRVINDPNDIIYGKNRQIGGSFNGRKALVYQALVSKKWDYRKVKLLTDLGVPAFNTGWKFMRTGDYGNGLALMIRGLTHVYAFATRSEYDPKSQRFELSMRFVFYDVFGLNYQDLIDLDSFKATDAFKCIVAWWQLQHQFGYAPLITRFVVEKNYEFFVSRHNVDTFHQ